MQRFKPELLTVRRWRWQEKMEEKEEWKWYKYWVHKWNFQKTHFKKPGWNAENKQLSREFSEFSVMNQRTTTTAVRPKEQDGREGRRTVKARGRGGVLWNTTAVFIMAMTMKTDSCGEHLHKLRQKSREGHYLAVRRESAGVWKNERGQWVIWSCATHSCIKQKNQQMKNRSRIHIHGDLFQ